MIVLTGWLVAGAVGAWALRLRSALSWRAELVARACHELRGPITVARLGLELHARECGSHPGGGRPDALSAIDLELASAGRALEDLSAARAGRRGPWRVDAVDMPALLTASVEAFRPVALARGVELDLCLAGEPGVVAADRLRLAQATRNLIANALEHGEGRVELRGSAGDAGFEIMVSDAGRGLPTSLDVGMRARGGRGRRGHGLKVAAEVAERHGGRLVADGPRVTLVVPAQRG